jgi:hypothetical protein
VPPIHLHREPAAADADIEFHHSAEIEITTAAKRRPSAAEKKPFRKSKATTAG